MAYEFTDGWNEIDGSVAFGLVGAWLLFGAHLCYEHHYCYSFVFLSGTVLVLLRGKWL